MPAVPDLLGLLRQRQGRREIRIGPPRRCRITRMSPGAPQNSIIGGASLWVMGGKKPEEYKGVAKFFTFLSDADRQARHPPGVRLPADHSAAYEKTKASGFYEKNPSLEIALIELTSKEPTENSRGLRLGNMVQFRDIWAEEIEAALRRSETPPRRRSTAPSARQPVLRQFEKTPMRRDRRSAVHRRPGRCRLSAAPGLKRGRTGRAAEARLPGCAATAVPERRKPCVTPRAWNALVFPGPACCRMAVAAARDHARLLLLAGRPGVWQSFLLQDAFGLTTRFVWLENFAATVQPDPRITSRPSRHAAFFSPAVRRCPCPSPCCSPSWPTSGSGARAVLQARC